jgi:hypothetical protein
MAIQTVKVTTFRFTIPRPETTYTFAINAESEPEAAQKCIDDLAAIIEELRLKLKAAMN